MSAQDANDSAVDLVVDGMLAGGAAVSCAGLLPSLTRIAQTDHRHARAALAAAKFQDSRFHEIHITARDRWTVLIQINSESGSTATCSVTVKN
jgi:hypothetical protein